MKQPTQILAATDLSAPARHAVDRACFLAAKNGCILHLIHALELDSLDSLRELLGVDLTSAKTALEAGARERLEQLAAEQAPHLTPSLQMRVVSGKPLHVITSEADAVGADLIVLGARGESLLRRAILGSMATRLLRLAASCPVLIVKQPALGDFRNALVAVDFSPTSPGAIKVARQWAPSAALVLLHALELPHEGMLWRAGVEQYKITQYINAELNNRRSRLHDLAAQAGLGPADYRALVVHGDPSQQIITVEQEYDIDLIVVGKHGMSMTAEMLLGSVTKHVLAEVQADVLVVPDPGTKQNTSMVQDDAY